jgi:hypothetical protein
MTVRFNDRYAIETMYVGAGKKPWEGWVITRRYKDAYDRDIDFANLQGVVSSMWAYRIKGAK